MAALIAGFSFTGAVLGAGYNAHSSPKNVVKYLELEQKLPHNAITEKIFWLMGMDPKNYPFTYEALEKGVSPKIAEKLLPVDYTKQGMERILELAKSKSEYEEAVESPAFQAQMKLNKPYGLSGTEKEFLEVFVKLPEEKQELALGYVKDGIISWSDVYSVKEISKLPLKTLENLKKSGHLYPIIDKDKDGIPDTKDINPRLYNPIYLVLCFPSCDPPKSWDVFNDPGMVKTDKAILNNIAKGFEEKGVPKSHIYLFPGNLSKEGFLTAMNEIATDIATHYSGEGYGRPYIYIVIDTHGSPHDIWAPGNYTTQQIENLDKEMGANFDPRPFLIYDNEMASAIENIERASGKPPVLCLTILACHSDEFIKNVLKDIPGSEKKPYFGLTDINPDFVSKRLMAWDDRTNDRNGIMDYSEFCISYNRPIEKPWKNITLTIGHITALKKYMFFPVPREGYEDLSWKLNHSITEKDAKMCLPEFNRPSYPADYLKAFFGS